MLALPYLSITLLFALCALSYEFATDENRKRHIWYVAAFAFVFFFVFRGYLYTDWTVYYPYFEDVEWKDLLKWRFDEVGVYEPGFALLNLVCKEIFPHYLFLQAVDASICVALLFRFANRQQIANKPLFLLVFFTFSGLVMFFNLLRNSIAILIWLNAMDYLVNRKLWKYLAMCLLAVLFHFSSIVFIPLYFVLNIRLNRWVFLAFFSLFAAIYLSKISMVMLVAKMIGLGSFLEGRIEVYTELMMSSRSGFTIGFMERVATALLITLYYDELRSVRKCNVVVINCILIYFFAYFCLAEVATFSERVSMLFVFSYWVLWCDLLRCFFYENNRRLFLVCITLYCVVRVVPIIQKPVQEYDNILFGVQSYEERMQMYEKTYEDDNEL